MLKQSVGPQTYTVIQARHTLSIQIVLQSSTQAIYLNSSKGLQGKGQEAKGEAVGGPAAPGVTAELRPPPRRKDPTPLRGPRVETG